MTYTTEEMREKLKNRAVDFSEWLMDNCELVEASSYLWSYKSKHYSLEVLYENFLKSNG